MANISGLFQMLNNNVSAHPLAQPQNTQVEGQPQRPMDNINPLLAMGARGVGGAMGANNTGRLDNSQQAQAKRQAQHRQVLAKQASDLGMVDLAKSIMSGDVPNEVAMKAIMAQKQADAQSNAATDERVRAQKEKLRRESREDKIARLKREQYLADQERERVQYLSDEARERGYTVADREAEDSEGPGPMGPTMENIYREEAELNNEAAATMNSSLSTAQQMEGLTDQSGGWLKGADEWKKKFYGTRDEESALRTQYNRIKNSSVMLSLPPGVASDKDIEIAMSGFPPANATPGEIAEFLRGVAKMSFIENQYRQGLLAHIDKYQTQSGYSSVWAKKKKSPEFKEAFEAKFGSSGPTVGDTEGGYTFTGGDPKDPANWSAK